MEPPDPLPPDLTRYGYKLKVLSPDRMFAISWCWGCTEVLDNLDAVVKQARDMIRYLEWRRRKEGQEAKEMWVS